MSNKRVVIETLKKKKAELYIEREAKWKELSTAIQEIDDALVELGEFVGKEFKHEKIYDDQNPDYIKSSSVED